MKRLFALLCLLPLLTVAQSKLKPAPKPKLKLIQLDVREIGGTNYNVHNLEHWIVNNLTNARPLVDWRELRAKVVQVTADGALLERTVETVYREPVRDPLARIGGFSGRADNSISFARRTTPLDYGNLFLLTRHPDGNKLIDGRGVRVLAMRVGNYKFTDTKGVERTIAKFDFGKPVTPVINAPAKTFKY